MKVKIRDVTFIPNSLVVKCDFYYSEGEQGYDDCWVEVSDYPATEEEPNPPTHLEFRSFRSESFSFPLNITKIAAKDTMVERLQELKAAHTRLQQITPDNPGEPIFIGWEYEI